MPNHLPTCFAPRVLHVAAGLVAVGVTVMSSPGCADANDSSLASEEDPCLRTYAEFYEAPDSSAALTSSLGSWYAARVRERRTTSLSGTEETCEVYGPANAPRRVEVFPDGTFVDVVAGETTNGMYVVVPVYPIIDEGDSTRVDSSAIAYWRVRDRAEAVMIPSILPGAPYADGGGTEYEGEGVRGVVTNLMERE